MPTYEFQKLSDGEIIERFYKIIDCPPLDSIVEIDGEKCKRIVSGSICVTVDMVKGKTLAMVAQKNSAKMEKRGDPKMQPKPKPPKPFWRDTDKVDIDLAKMNKRQKTKYIMEGRK